MILSPTRLALVLIATSSLMWMACDDDGDSKTDTTVEDTTTEDTTPDDSTVTDTTVEDTTVEDTTVEDTTVEDTTVEDTTVEDTTMDDTTMDDTTMDDTTMEDTAMDDTTDTSTPTATNAADLRQAIAAATELPVSGTYTVTAAIVTGVKPAAGSDAEGFFIQDGPTGPAIFVVYDLNGADDTDTCGPAVGDTVDFTGTALDIDNGVAQVTVVSTLACTDAGASVAEWSQSLDAEADISAVLDAYESELVSVSGDITGTPFVGSGHEGYLFTNPAGGVARLRMPEEVATTVEAGTGRIFGVGCTFVLDGTPLWRFRADAQPSVYTNADAAANLLAECPATKLLAAAAFDPNTVVLTFNRDIDGASITDAPTQFTIDNSITVISATASGNRVTVVTDESMTEIPTYTVTVAATVKDTEDIAIETGASAMFQYAPIPVLLVNELDYDQAGDENREFIEIYNPNAEAVDLAGYTVEHINGNGGTNIFTIDLTEAGTSIPGLGYLVIHDEAVTVTAPALSINANDGGSSFSVQNGNDAVSVLFNGIVIDSVAYQGAVEGAGEGSPAADEPNADGVSLARCPNGADTDDNSVDFALTSTITAGTANICVAPL